jgi:hypothetical protein
MYRELSALNHNFIVYALDRKRDRAGLIACGVVVVEVCRVRDD